MQLVVAFDCFRNEVAKNLVIGRVARTKVAAEKAERNSTCYTFLMRKGSEP